MQRRKFIQDAGLFAVGFGVFGSIRWSENHFVGDSPTTTDILGPFYRPGAPFRKNLNPANFNGEILHLSGTIFEDDSKTPIKNCLIEIWQCKQDTFYDNVSDEFEYRASQHTNSYGRYSFTTAIPIPYPAGDNPGVFRPAHIHMRISAKGEQDLITQIYIKGDPYLDTDPSTKNSLSINRILTLKKIKEKESELKFDITLRKEYVPDNSVFHKVSGLYKMDDNSMMEFYRDKDFLFWKWNGQIRGGLSYAGNNTFSGGANDTEIKFELLPQGNAKVFLHFIRRREIKLAGKKLVTYNSPA